MSRSRWLGVGALVVLGCGGGSSKNAEPDAAPATADARTASADAPLGSADAHVTDGPSANADAGTPAGWIRVSVDSSGNQAMFGGVGTAVSGDGRYTAFYSASDLAGTGTTPAASQIYLHDRTTGATTRLLPVEADGDSSSPFMSPDARFFAFDSNATNLVTGDTNALQDCFVFDAIKQQITRVSVSSTGAQSNGDCYIGGVSDDGNIVVFESDATNLVPADTDSGINVFVHDVAKGTTSLVDLAMDGSAIVSPAESSVNALSADGRWVVFSSSATNLVSGDTNGVPDAFVRDLMTGTTTRVSVSTADAEGNDESYGVAITPDGRYVLFGSYATNLVTGDTNANGDTFLRDLTNGTTIRVGVGDSGQEAPDGTLGVALTSDGDGVIFSTQSALVAGDTNIYADTYLRRIGAATTVLLTVGPGGVPCNDDCSAVNLSRDGSTIVLSTDATTLITGDTNNFSDVYEGPVP